MPKHTRKKRPKSPSGHIMGLMHSLILDLYHDLPEQLRENAKNCTALSELRKLVGKSLADAEESLQSAGVRRYAALRQLDAFLKKNTDGAEAASVRKDRALELFFQSELACAEVNLRIRDLAAAPLTRLGLVHDALDLARQEVYKLLGHFDEGDLEACLEGCDFGPGLTFGSRNRDESHLYYKVGGAPITYTPGTEGFLPVLREVFPAWFAELERSNVIFQKVSGNRLTTVPKTAVIDRTIAIEPALNVFLQKGVESVLRRYLQRWGVTIRDQTRNHGPARIGSVNGYFSTLDLSSASDSMSTELVKWLLPPAWYRYIDAIRSPEFSVDKGGTWRKYEKFSSMGNATTFPLESLIFMALSRACARITGTQIRELRVYGDDIIVPRSMSLLLIEVLSFCGFSTNRSKSFIFGPFRESCGVDYFSGIDVRPVYLKRYPRTEEEAYSLFNRLRRSRFGFSFDNTLRYIWDSVPDPCLCPSDIGVGEGSAWNVGSHRMFSAGFEVPKWYVDRFKRPSRALQSMTWRVPILGTRLRSCDEGFREELRYLTFLLGNKGGEVQLPSSRITYRAYRTFSVWRDVGEWPFWLVAVMEP